MTRLRATQLTAIALILTAGFLWSQRLAKQTFQANAQAISHSIEDQLAVVQQKVADNDNAVELYEFGRKSLSAGNAQFAILPLERAVKLEPSLRDAWYLLGYSYTQLAAEITDKRQQAEKQDYLNRAVEALQQAHSLDAQHQPTRDLLRQLGQNLD